MDPLFKQQRNKRTGEIRDLMSHDGGRSWMVVPATEEAPAGPAEIAAPPSPVAAPAPAPTQPMSAMDMVMELGRRGADSIGGGMQSAGEALYDGSVGLSQGASMGGADELMGAMPGTSIEQQQAIRDAARARSPMVYDAANAAGSMIPAAMTAGGSMVEQAIMALAQGGLGGFLGSDGDMQERAQSGMVGAGTGAAMSGAGSALGGLAKPLLANLANGQRAAAIATPGDFAILARKEGLDFTYDQLPAQMERMGLVNKIIPQSAAGFARKAGAVREAAASRHGAALDTATAEGAHGYLDPIEQALQALASKGARNRGSLGEEQEAVANKLIDRLGPVNNTRQNPRELWELKKEYEESGGYVPDDIKNLPAGQGPLINQQAAGYAREELANAMDLATPETHDAFNAANSEYGFAAVIENLAKESAIQAAKPSSNNWANFGWIGGGGMLGATQGPVGALAGAAAGAGTQSLVRRYGHDAAANGLSLGSSASGHMGATMRSTAGASGQAAGRSFAETEARKTMDEGRGQHLEDVVIQVLNSQPEMLGQYQQQLQEAQESGDPMRLVAALSDLNQDHRFRTTVGAQLMQMTARSR
jgi:hypothetical protein